MRSSFWHKSRLLSTMSSSKIWKACSIFLLNSCCVKRGIASYFDDAFSPGRLVYSYVLFPRNWYIYLHCMHRYGALHLGLYYSFYYSPNNCGAPTIAITLHVVNCFECQFSWRTDRNLSLYAYKNDMGNFDWICGRPQTKDRGLRWGLSKTFFPGVKNS